MAHLLPEYMEAKQGEPKLKKRRLFSFILSFARVAFKVSESFKSKVSHTDLGDDHLDPGLTLVAPSPLAATWRWGSCACNCAQSSSCLTLSNLYGL